MSAKEDPTVEMNDNEIHELNLSALQAHFLHAAFDFHKIAKDTEAEFQEVCKQLQKSYNPTMRNEHNRLKSLTYTSHSSWPLTERAAAGFYHTLVKSSMHCFSGLVLFTMARCAPYKQHNNFCPTCEFVLGKEVGNISKYDIGVQKLEKNPAGYTYTYSAEHARWQSFDRWPTYATGEKPDVLARAGFFFRRKKDIVQCFACGGCLGNWEDGDDPWRKQAEWFPESEFLQSKKSSEEIKKYIETYNGFVVVEKAIEYSAPSCAGCLQEWEEVDLFLFYQTHCKANLEKKATLHSVGADMTLVESQCLQEVKNLTKQLTKAYNSNSFSKLFFGNSNHLAIDLKLPYGDLSVVSKDINDQPIQQPFLYILANLDSTVVLEGEAESGKTALLGKIALLWALGCCLLSRFKFVFSLSLTYVRSDHSMADIICNQPVVFVGLLRDVIQPLKKQVLFLSDYYREMNSVPQIVEELTQRNHLYPCLVVAVHTNRTREIHKYATTTLNIAEFPLSSTPYVLKKLFPYIDLVEQSLFQLECENPMQTILKTPLCVVSLAVYWVQHPKGNVITDEAILRPIYLLCHLLKYFANLVLSTVFKLPHI
ncbi:LOW QUALITY PROTEIN: baculoviral IAP repeat-containing protein 1 [Chlamydotis macqueenii]